MFTNTKSFLQVLTVAALTGAFFSGMPYAPYIALAVCLSILGILYRMDYVAFQREEKGRRDEAGERQKERDKNKLYSWWQAAQGHSGVKVEDALRNNPVTKDREKLIGFLEMLVGEDKFTHTGKDVYAWRRYE